MTRREAQMINPIVQLLHDKMFVDVAEQEFSAGYGIADVVGARLCSESCQQRESLGLNIPFNHIQYVSVLLLLRENRWSSFTSLAKKISFSETTLRQKILPKLSKLKIIERNGDFFRLCINLPNPAQNLIAVEAKQTKWREAILQARRYTFFADQTYIAVWSSTIKSVDRAFLYRHRIGLISVEDNYAEIIIDAPKRKPREARLNMYCAEFLYGLALSNQITSVKEVPFP